MNSPSSRPSSSSTIVPKGTDRNALLWSQRRNVRLGRFARLKGASSNEYVSTGTLFHSTLEGYGMLPADFSAGQSSGFSEKGFMNEQDIKAYKQLKPSQRVFRIIAVLVVLLPPTIARAFDLAPAL